MGRWTRLALLMVVSSAALARHSRFIPSWVEKRWVVGQQLNAVYKEWDPLGADSDVWVVGNDGLLLRTSDGGGASRDTSHLVSLDDAQAILHYCVTYPCTH